MRWGIAMALLLLSCPAVSGQGENEGKKTFYSYFTSLAKEKHEHTLSTCPCQRILGLLFTYWNESA